ncbi:MAG: hypothetical protein KDA84_26565 [Planctomycetaceae bacterium]|nr:hypothetical protein [Planctomycetaceae bacterium]
MNVVWPELSGLHPLHPREILEVCPTLVGKVFCTLSEHIILWFQQKVRAGEIRPNQLTIIWVGPKGASRVEVDWEGDLVNWPGPFFSERLELLR